MAEIFNSAIFMSYGKYPHPISINLWNGYGINKANKLTPGLEIANLSIPSVSQLNKIEQQLIKLNYPYTKKDHSLLVNDPSGNPFRLYTNL